MQPPPPLPSETTREEASSFCSNASMTQHVLMGVAKVCLTPFVKAKLILLIAHNSEQNCTYVKEGAQHTSVTHVHLYIISGCTAIRSALEVSSCLQCSMQ